jgi:hypothetical protein
MQKGVSLFAHKHFPYNSFHSFVFEFFFYYFFNSSLVLFYFETMLFSLLNLSYILCLKNSF